MVNMPPLSHRPDPSVPLCAENSEVLRFLTEMGYTLVKRFLWHRGSCKCAALYSRYRTLAFDPWTM